MLEAAIRVGAIEIQTPFPSLIYPVEQSNAVASKIQFPYPSEWYPDAHSITERGTLSLRQFPNPSEWNPSEQEAGITGGLTQLPLVSRINPS